MALTALLKLRQPSSIDVIVGQLRSPDSDIRWQAANALARIREGIGVATPSLLAVLDDKEALVRANAARALGVAKSVEAVDPLIKLLSDKDDRVVASAIVALGTIGDRKATDPLLSTGKTLLEGYRASDREKLGVPVQQNQLLLIATALGSIADERALPFLKSLRLVDGKVGKHLEAELATAKFGEAAFFDMPATIAFASDDWKAMATYAQALGQLGGEKAKAQLLDLLNGKTYGKPDIRAVPPILRALSTSKAEGMFDILLKHLESSDVYVREAAASLLGELGDSSDRIIGSLYEAYKAARADKINEARLAIVEAADKLKHPMNIQVLSDTTRDEDYVIRLKAAELLRATPTETVSGNRLQIGKV